MPLDREESKWKELLVPFKVIRDPVHKDIWITEFEAKIIDSDVFQRLHDIRQLGLAHLVYPAAKHSRFEHCIGCLFIAQKIIDAVQRNYENREIVLGPLKAKLESRNLSIFSLTDRDIVLARIAALLHDAAHVPYGHILEKEGCLIKKSQWADEKRVKYFFDDCGMRQKVTSYLLERGFSSTDSGNFVNELISILKAIEGVGVPSGELADVESPEDEAISTLPHPYIGDIVGNTLCADLFDYVLRDSYFTGLRLSSELRIIDNFAIIGQSRKQARLTLLLARKGKLRFDTLSGAIQFLRERYFLAERVYYHRVKSAASAMLNRAIYSYYKGIGKSLEMEEVMKELMRIGDDALVYKILEGCENIENNRDKEAAQFLLKNLKSRKLYKLVYMVYARQEGRDRSKLDELIEKYTNPEERYKFERYIEELLSLTPGSIILYITKRDKGKAARTRCLWIDGKVRVLEEIGHNEMKTLGMELDTLREKYEQLWRLYVFMEREACRRYQEYLVSFCKWKLFEMNDLEMEGFQKYRAKDEAEIYLDAVVKAPYSSEQRKLFIERINSLKTAPTGEFSEIGVPKSTLEKVFNEILMAG
jgi:HD superfamily phosphohydrolase